MQVMKSEKTHRGRKPSGKYPELAGLTGAEYYKKYRLLKMKKQQDATVKQLQEKQDA